ncbi:MAG: glycosyltransferase [Blautia sp.]|nr:glycosyltransferase [Blautia sp.]MCM1200924.1 glycosyltransferase [Bacteroides fragilis]
MKKKNYKISVIVAVYNVHDYLEQCIDSILLQTYENLELLLIDDESTDGSGAICDRYADQDERVRVIHQKNSGCTAASLKGLREASGDYYMFVDSDDYVETEMLREMMKHLIGKKGEVVCCNHILEKKRKTLPAVCPAAPGVYEGEKLKREIRNRLIGNEQRTIPLSRCMKLYEKSVFEGNEKLSDTTILMGDDLTIVYPAMLDCTRVVIMENALFYHYRYVENSTVHGYLPNMLDGLERLRNFLLMVSKEKGIRDNREAIDREYCYMLLLVMKNELRNPDKDYIRNIRKIFLNEKVRERVLNTPLSVRERSNQLLYLGMQYPEKMLLRILRGIIRIYDRK